MERRPHPRTGAPSQGRWGPQNPAHHPESEPSCPLPPWGRPHTEPRSLGDPLTKTLDGEGYRYGGWTMGHSTLRPPEHQLQSEMDLKPENSLLQRYKSVTAEMYSNKLGGSRGTGRVQGTCPMNKGHHIGSLLNNLYHDKSSTKINIEMKQLSG